MKHHFVKTYFSFKWKNGMLDAPQELFTVEASVKDEVQKQISGEDTSLMVIVPVK